MLEAHPGLKRWTEHVFRLDAAAIYSKHGFGDGDLLCDVVWDLDDAIGRPGLRVRQQHVLWSIFRSHLAPLIPAGVVQDDNDTDLHNPIRAVDFRDRWFDPPAWANWDDPDAVSVDVPFSSVVAAYIALRDGPGAC